MDQFRKKNPQQAQEIESIITPHHEHQALAYVKELQGYNNNDPQHQLSVEKKRLFEEQAEQMVKSTAVMNYLCHHLPDVAKQAQKTAHDSQSRREQHQAIQHQQKIQRERSYGLEL